MKDAKDALKRVFNRYSCSYDRTITSDIFYADPTVFMEVLSIEPILSPIVEDINQTYEPVNNIEGECSANISVPLSVQIQTILTPYQLWRCNQI